MASSGRDEDRHFRRQLPESSRLALTYIAERLREGYTGTFELDCREGGVRMVFPRERIDVQKLKQLRNERRQSGG